MKELLVTGPWLNLRQFKKEMRECVVRHCCKKGKRACGMKMKMFKGQNRIKYVTGLILINNNLW